jgi:GNAT superfamily N-acetyltransferase
MGTDVADVVRVTPGVHWHALEDDVVVGRGYALHRSDRRVFVSVDTWRDDVFATLAEVMVGDLARPVYTLVAEDDVEHLGRWSAAGFLDHRREDEVVIPTDPAANGLGTATPPSGYTLVTADQVEFARLHSLDDRLRQDVPGTRGWVSTPEAFRGATFDRRSFDPATYRVAVHDGTGDLAGLARVWRGHRVPRLGLVGVLPVHRRRGLARALLATAFAPLHLRGVPEVTAEVDEAHVPGQALLAALGARRTGGVVELVHRP